MYSKFNSLYILQLHTSDNKLYSTYLGASSITNRLEVD